MDRLAVSTSLASRRPEDPTPIVEAYLRSDRVSPPLLALLVRRAERDDPAYEPKSVSPAQFRALRAALEEVIPQDGGEPIDLAARLDAMMAEKDGNGWRYEALPSDPDAYHHGLDALDEAARAHGTADFAALSPAGRAAILRRAETGDLSGGGLDGAQMKLWFEELRSDAVRLYVAHPRTMARLGYGGVRNGHDGGAGFTGFRRIGIGEREDFEPLPAPPEGAR